MADNPNEWKVDPKEWNWIANPAGAAGLNVPDPQGKGPMSGKSAGPAPSAPDFQAIAQQQTADNRPTQTNASGATSQWGVGSDGRPTQTTSWGGAMGDAQKSLQGQFAQANANPLDNGTQARQHAEDAIYGRETSRLDPQWQQREHDFQTQLANQGIDPNSEAYSKAMDNFGRSRNDAYSGAQKDSIIGGGQEASRQQSMDLQARMAPEQQLAGMEGMSQMPQFAHSQLLPAAIAQYQGALQGYGIQNQGKNSQMSGLSNLGGSALMYAAMA